MEIAKLPDNETLRLETLEAYQVLDTMPEAEFDDLTIIASQICGTPIALISLVDKSRQWFKSKLGLDVSETPRELAFCAHAILQDGLFLVPNAANDPRFHDNPLVTDGPKIRFYAGAVLETPNGSRLGTVCLIDHKPREMTPDQQRALIALSRQVVNQLELRRQLKEINEARKAALNAAEFKATFLANMSHEIRTPMNGVVGMTTLLLRTPLNPQQKDYTETILQSAESLLLIINDILDISKIEAGQLRLEHIDFDLKDELNKIMKTVRFAAQSKGLTLLLKDLPALPLLQGDPGRLRQVLLNLVSNAVKFTAKGGVTIEVKVNAENTDFISLNFSVQDTGIGIPVDAHDKIFNAFSQADSSMTRKFGGTGLGLAISKELVSMMGGKVQLASAPGIGSTFSFTLPFELGHAVPVAANDEKTPAKQSRARILVAEDNLINQKVIQGLLHDKRFEVTMVNNGLEAVRSANLDKYDIILMDCQMPQMSGFEATAEIRNGKGNTPPKVPILALTAGSMEGDRKRCLAAGMDDYLTKPIKEKALLQKIDSWLGRAQETTAEENEPKAEKSALSGDFIFDLSVLERLRALETDNGAYFVDDAIQLFLDAAPNDLNDIRETLRAGDAEHVAQFAHKFKSGCFSLGALSMGETCMDLEALALTGKMGESADAMVQRLEKELALSVEHLKSAMKVKLT